MLAAANVAETIAASEGDSCYLCIFYTHEW